MTSAATLRELTILRLLGGGCEHHGDRLGVPDVDKVVNATVKNPNPYGVNLETVEVISVTADTTHATAGCTEEDSGASGVPPVKATIDGYPTIAAGGTSGNIPVTVRLDVSSDDACQGAVFTVNLKVTGSSSD